VLQRVGANYQQILNVLSFVSVNCNSLNLSSNTELYDHKMHALSTLNHDIIFLSDIRMGEINNQSAEHRVKTTLLKSGLRNHEFIFK
jgi:hypothetical protein